MNPSEFPDDLEREMQDRLLPGANAAYRQRVLTAMRAELQLPVVPGGAAGFSWLAGLTAAAVLLAINFSMSVANDADFPLADKLQSAALTTTARELRAAAPELSEDEAYRHALVFRAGSGVAAAPQARSFPGRMVSDKEQ